jgi:trigger factor
VQTAVLPELNDEFITAFGVTEGGVEKFHSDVRKNMERELKQGIKNNIKTQVLDGLVTTHNIEVPKAMVANEIQRLRENMMRQFGGNAKNINPSMLPDELFTEQGKRAAALGLLVGEIIKSTAMKVDGDRVKALIEEIAESYETPADVLNWYYGNKEQMQQIESVVLEDQVIDHVLSQAQIC